MHTVTNFCKALWPSNLCLQGPSNCTKVLTKVGRTNMCLFQQVFILFCFLFSFSSRIRFVTFGSYQWFLLIWNYQPPLSSWRAQHRLKKKVVGLLGCWLVGLLVCCLLLVACCLLLVASYLLFVVCGFVGLWVCWFVGLLVCWFVGLLVCWFVGLLVCWFVGLLVCWFVGLLVCWFVGLLVWWFGGLVVWWFGGLVVWWFGGCCLLVCCLVCGFGVGCLVFSPADRKHCIEPQFGKINRVFTRFKRDLVGTKRVLIVT